jgi:hypothetical protein
VPRSEARSRLFGVGRLVRTEESFQQARLAGPGRDDDVTGYLTAGVAQREGDHDDVVELDITTSRSALLST